MYNYEWDAETGGYILTTKITGVTKEVRPVFEEELKFLELDKNYGWDIPECVEPLMWAEGRRYFYRGVLVAEAVGGGLYSMPIMKNVVRNLSLKPVNIQAMVAKNEDLMNGLVQRTLHFVYDTYKQYEDRVSLFYVAFSAGKDSMVMLDIVQRALPHDSFVVVYGDTTMELNATYKAVEDAKKRWPQLEWYTARAPFNAIESWGKIGYPARRLRWCCSVHKTAPSIQKLREIYKEKYPESNKPFKVMVFDGIRAEESDARAAYSMISEGNKHAVQANCSPIHEWNTTELFIYMFANDIPINELYRYGSHRVGCKLCPMASEWYECILNHVYPDQIKPLLDIVDGSTKKSFGSQQEKEQYLESGGWKSRVGGKDISLGENKITEIKKTDKIVFIIKGGNYKWDKWLPTVGDLVKTGRNSYSIRYHELSMEFDVTEENDSTIVTVPILIKSKTSIRFMYLFKNALFKAAYCENCRECMAECAFGALAITDDDIQIKGCRHCESCLDSSKGCIVARSLGITGEGNNMSALNISRYQNFGFRQEWLDLYFELGDNFWNNDRMGKYMVIGFKTWLKESGITENNAITTLGNKLNHIGVESPVTWGIIFANLVYNSPIINWYVRKIDLNRAVSHDEMVILLGDAYSPTVKKNALSSLKETIRLSPIGGLLGQGKCEMKGKVVTSITRTGWFEPEPLVMLYTLYLFAEHSDGLYSFTLSELIDDSDDREAISPNLIFGVSSEMLRPILQGLAHDYSDYIQVDFNNNLMENIFLNRDKTAEDIAALL